MRHHVGTNCAVPAVLYVPLLETVSFLLVQPLLLTLHFFKHLGRGKTKNFHEQQDLLAQYLAA